MWRRPRSRARDEHGRPLCPSCLVADPVNHETCVICDRRRSVSVRTTDGPTVRPATSEVDDCAICARFGPAMISETTGNPWCEPAPSAGPDASAAKRSRRAGRHHRAASVRHLYSSRTRLLAQLHRLRPIRSHPRRSLRALQLQRRLRGLLGDEEGRIRPELQTLLRPWFGATTGHGVAWLENSTAPECGVVSSRPGAHARDPRPIAPWQTTRTPAQRVGRDRNSARA